MTPQPTPDEAAQALRSAQQAKVNAVSYDGPPWQKYAVVGVVLAGGLALDVIAPTGDFSPFDTGLLVALLIVLAVVSNTGLLRRLGSPVAYRRSGRVHLAGIAVTVPAVVVTVLAADAIVGADLPLRHTIAALLYVALFVLVTPLSRWARRLASRGTGS